MKLVSIHVPKTGGTSLRGSLIRHFSVGTFYNGRLKCNGHPDIVHGHLPVSEARRRWPGVPVVAFVRNPYDQIRSNYDHYLGQPDTMFDPGIGRLPEGLGLAGFIRLPEMRNYQCQFVDEAPDFLGTTERMAEGLATVAAMFDVDVPLPKPDNVTRGRSRMTQHHRDLIDLLHADDLALWGGA